MRDTTPDVRRTAADLSSQLDRQSFSEHNILTLAIGLFLLILAVGATVAVINPRFLSSVNGVLSDQQFARYRAHRLENRARLAEGQGPRVKQLLTN